MPTTWTDSDTGTVYNLSGPLLDADDDYWHHIGWLTLDDPPIPLMVFSPTAYRGDLSRRLSDVDTLPNVIGAHGPLRSVNR